MTDHDLPHHVPSYPEYSSTHSNSTSYLSPSTFKQTLVVCFNMGHRWPLPRVQSAPQSSALPSSSFCQAAQDWELTALSIRGKLKVKIVSSNCAHQTWSRWHAKMLWRKKRTSKFEGLRSQIPNDIKAAMESICLAWAQQKGLDEASRMDLWPTLVGAAVWCQTVIIHSFGGWWWWLLCRSHLEWVALESKTAFCWESIFTVGVGSAAILRYASPNYWSWNLKCFLAYYSLGTFDITWLFQCGLAFHCLTAYQGWRLWWKVSHPNLAPWMLLAFSHPGFRSKPAIIQPQGWIRWAVDMVCGRNSV